VDGSAQRTIEHAELPLRRVDLTMRGHGGARHRRWV
jgi:hypothetical protein